MLHFVVTQSDKLICSLYVPIDESQMIGNPASGWIDFAQGFISHVMMHIHSILFYLSVSYLSILGRWC